MSKSKGNRNTVLGKIKSYDAIKGDNISLLPNILNCAHTLNTGNEHGRHSAINVYVTRASL